MGMEDLYELVVDTLTTSTSIIIILLSVSLLLVPFALFLVFYSGADDPENSSWMFWRKIIGYMILISYGMCMLAVLMIISHHYFGLGLNVTVLLCLAAIGVLILNPYIDQENGQNCVRSKTMHVSVL